MTGYPALRNISVALLTGEAGDDPWQLDATLQSGEPGEISALSRAFFNAGACTEETYRDFVEAQRRFGAAWNRETGEHPINDSAEVQRAMRSVLFARDQLPVVAAGLADIAASLAEAQSASSRWIDSLNSELHLVDQLIDQAFTRRQNPSALENRAVNSTTVVVCQVKSLRDGYAADLAAAQTKLRLDGSYDPAIDDVDGDGAPGAGVRSDDLRMSRFVGPLPVDPMLGGDARTRARCRLDLRRRLETGALGLPAMTADEATRALDDAEHAARVLAAKEAVAAFTGLGMSRAGARRCVDLLSRGTSMRELLNQDSTILGGVGAGTKAAVRSLPTGTHAAERFSGADVAILRKFGHHMGVAGTSIDFVTGLWDVHTGQTTPLGLTGRLAGGAAVGWGAEAAAWATAGSVIGPEGALAAGLVASVLLSGFAGDLGEKAFNALDR